MPRVSRSSVEYPVAGRVWVATFHHQHARSRFTRTQELKFLLLGIARAVQGGHLDAAHKRLIRAEELMDDSFVREDPVIVTINNRKTEVQHSTTCLLKHKDASIVIRGTSYCSLKDNYNWRLGIKESLRIALGKIAIHPKKQRVWDDEAGKYGMEVDKRCIDEGVAFTAHMTSFFAEMRIKAYSNGSIPPTQALMLPMLMPQAPHAQQPTAIMHQIQPSNGWHGFGHRHHHDAHMGAVCD